MLKPSGGRAHYSTNYGLNLELSMVVNSHFPAAQTPRMPLSHYLCKW